MASVYYLFDDAFLVADDIVEKYSQQDKNLTENHFAATIIQRSYRGYVVRKTYKKIIGAAVVLQKYIRGWLVRYHLPDVLQEHYDNMCLERYHSAAAKIQAAWKGTLVRREVDIKKIMEEKRMTEQRTREALPASFDLQFDSAEKQETQNAGDSSDDVQYLGKPQGQDRAIREKILDLMFDRHHLLSTKVHNGVLANNSELEEIEKVLKVLPWKNYIKKLRKIYYKYQKAEKELEPAFMFEDKRMRRQEKLLLLRDKSHDVKQESCIGDFIVDDREPFDLYSKPDQQTYERSLLSEGKYIRRQTRITRTEDKSKNISETDFILTLKEIVEECKVPPYYADFWYKECMGHHLDD